MSDGWIQTFTGRKVYPLAMAPADVDVRDVAHALAMQCRFGGHARAHYSVAQHSVLVSRACDPADALWGLLHDASEAYLVDLPRPLKRLPEFAPYREAEARLMRVVCERFGLPEREPASVGRADNTLLVTEARDLMAPLHPDWAWEGALLPERIEPWGPVAAEQAFLARFHELHAD